MRAASHRHVAVIVNPIAGDGRARRLIEPVRNAFCAAGAAVQPVRIHISEHAGQERALVSAALADGCDTIVAVGGDGTINHAANAILHAGGTARLVPIAAGTGNDFVWNTAFAHRDLRGAADAAFGDHDRRIDVGQVEDSFFVNSCGFGFDVAVLDAMLHARAQRTVLRGQLLYIAAALTQLRRYRGFNASVGDSPRFNHLLIVVANGARFGGAFTIAPRAVMTDGLLDLVELWQTRSTMRRLKLLVTAMRGRQLRNTEVRATQMRAATITFDAPPVCQTDGERRQLREPVVTIRTIPQALRIGELPA